MASPADTIMRILAMKQQQGMQNKRLNQVALNRFFDPVNRGIERGSRQAQQRHLQGQAQTFQGEQRGLDRTLTTGEAEKTRTHMTDEAEKTRGFRSGEAEKGREFAAGEHALDRDLTRENIGQNFRLRMAAIGARKQEGMAERAQELAMQHAAFKQRDDEFKKQTRVAFARDVRGAMEEAKGDQRRAQASISAIQERYKGDLALQTRAAAISAAAASIGGGKKDIFGLATPTAYLTSGASILKGNAMGDRFEWVTPEMERDIMLVMRASFKKASGTLKEQDPELWKILDESLKVLEEE